MVSKVILPDNTQVEVNWATEEVQREILSALKQDKKGTSTENKKTEKTQKETNKRFKRLSDIVGKTHSKYDKLNGAIDSQISSLNDMDASAKSTTQGLTKLLGMTGALGTALGFAAATLDNLVDAQTAAIQSGFTFSDELINSREAIANIGLNFTQLSSIISEQGESIRNLGGTGGEAAKAFTDLVMTARDSTASMGSFGLSSEEIANEMADIIGTLVRSGAQGDELFERATESFSVLNQEVLGYARLTGQQRRELMRNRTAIDADALFLSTISELGEDAVAASHNMTDGLTAAFGEAAPAMIDIVKGLVVNMEEGIQTLSAEQIAATNASGMSPFFDQLAVNLINNSGNLEAASVQTSKILTDMVKYATDSEDIIRSELVRFRRAGNPLAEFYEQLLTGIVQGRTFQREIEKQGRTPFEQGLDDGTTGLLNFKKGLEVTMNKARAGILSVFGIDEGIITNFDLSKVNNAIDWTVDTTTNIKDFFAPDGLGVTTMVAGIAGLWAAPAVISALTTAIATSMAIGSFAGKGGQGLLGGLLGGKLAGGKNMLKGLAKNSPYLGLLLGAGFGVTDDQYTDAGYSGFDRAALGIFEGGFELADLAANAIAGPLVDPNDPIDMAGSFKEFITDPAVATWMQPYNWGKSQESSTSKIQAFEPGVASDGYRVPDQLTNTIAGVVSDTTGAITRPGRQMELGTVNMNAEQLAETKETNRLLRKYLSEYTQNN